MLVEQKSTNILAIPPIGTVDKTIEQMNSECKNTWNCPLSVSNLSWQTTTMVLWRRKKTQSFQRTQTVMDPLYLKTLLWYKFNITLNKSQPLKCFFIIKLFISNPNRVLGKQCGKKRVLMTQGMKSMDLDVNFSKMKVVLSCFLKCVHRFCSKQQLPADECRAARRWGLHMGKWWTPHRKDQLPVNRWYGFIFLINET